jgi:RNA polymerase sigma-70 factor (ECF subfamily)
MEATDTDAIFSGLRPRLTRLAYRMLGSVADAEDIVQDAWLRWLNHDRSDVREPAAFLQTIVTRLCVNELKSARRRRETYIGPWLPEPFFDPESGDVTEEITLPLMMALERLSPLERAAFLLHDVFGVGFEEVSGMLGRDAAACRKLASRARVHIRQARPRFSSTKVEGQQLAAAFYTASRTGDMKALRNLLTKDVVIYTDGGGQVAAPTSPSIGLDAALKLFKALARYFARAPSRLVRYAMIDGLPGFITVEAGGITQTSAFLVNNGRIAAIYVTRNPEKLHHLTRCGPH